MRMFSWLMIIVVLGLMYWFYDQNARVFADPVRFVYDIGLRDQLDLNSTVQGVLTFGAVIGFLAGVLVMLKPYFGARRRASEKDEEIQVLQRQLRQATLSAAALPQEERAALPDTESTTEELTPDSAASEKSHDSGSADKAPKSETAGEGNT